MARFEFGSAIEEQDEMVLQGVTYHLKPIGWRAQKAMLRVARDVNMPPEDRMDAAIDLIVSAVVPEEQDALREHIEERLGEPMLIVRMALELGRMSTDVDPTLLESLSAGSSTTGSSSMDGAPPEVLTQPI